MGSGRSRTICSSSFGAAFASAGCVGSLLFSLFFPLEGFFVTGVAATIALAFF